MSIALNLTAEHSNSYDDKFECRRIAIVGCGPRGMQCLETLDRVIRSSPRATCYEIVVYEATRTPGAGNVYAPHQPNFLRMNFASRHIDAYKFSADQTPSGRSLLDWLRKTRRAVAEPNAFLPRRVVGEYLSDCFRQIWSSLSQVATLRYVNRHVDSIRLDQNHWSVIANGDEQSFDEVVVTVGHEGFRSGGEKSALGVYPVETSLTVESVPPESIATLLGFGLTAIDAILALTEGRGGTFDNTRPLRRYIPSGLEPLRIEMLSRSGRPMLAKPSERLEPIAQAFWHPFQQRLRDLASRHGVLHFRRDIWPIVTSAADARLIESGAASRADTSGWFRCWQRYRMDGVSARRAMMQSLAVAMGYRPLDEPAALGEAWRQLYGELVPLISFGGLTADSYPCFRRTAVEMERIAFGPPAENVERILSLMRAGLVWPQPTRVSDPSIKINAVIAGPTDICTEGPLRSLLDQGQIRRCALSGGIQVDPQGRPMDENGVPRTGLAIFGRMTEGWVIGNDTLNRTLHTGIERWANSLVNAS